MDQKFHAFLFICELVSGKTVKYFFFVVYFFASILFFLLRETNLVNFFIDINLPSKSFSSMRNGKITCFEDSIGFVKKFCKERKDKNWIAFFFSVSLNISFLRGKFIVENKYWKFLVV